MKILSGSDLADFIKERQAKAVRGLRQANSVQPKLAIVVTADDPTIEIYTRLKKRYGADILIDVDIHHVKQREVTQLITALNTDESVHAIIVQLPLADPSATSEVVNLVAPEKDVDALGDSSVYDAATPTAILWLLAGYGVDFRDKKVVLVGRGKLVGAPLEFMLNNSGVNVTSCDENDDVEANVGEADIVITATGKPGALTSAMIPQGAVVVDAGVAVESGVTKGDLSEDVYTRDDLTLTPKKGGVGPLTVCALFENVIRAAKLSAK
ncbi:bifunctional 5,10-methylenetetrahydrofolate dehydrogenase/5,10-methenyltetrahydrofolate cyclohydrolase [Candidatus Saccharibacteria bacterium]|nr:bifunctional 5,10-methylenetetrahydrofolate dehydrogenase/5,10-methenyltetrahydrofolate cyclohydrolase [Candidatus Saccharibacteria bacterium]